MPALFGGSLLEQGSDPNLTKPQQKPDTAPIKLDKTPLKPDKSPLEFPDKNPLKPDKKKH